MEATLSRNEKDVMGKTFLLMQQEPLILLYRILPKREHFSSPSFIPEKYFSPQAKEPGKICVQKRHLRSVVGNEAR